MKLKNMYEEIINIGIAGDPRPKKDIDLLLKLRKSDFDKLSGQEKEYFDKESLRNPYADSRIVSGNPAADVKKILAGIDIDTAELLLAHTLNKQGAGIDLVLSHHPVGNALVSFYDVMDVQIDVFNQKGVALGAAEKLLLERKSEVARRVSAANFSKTKDAASLLGLNLMCAHTPADNLAYKYLDILFKKNPPGRLKNIIETLLKIPEYKDSACNGCPPEIVNGCGSSRVKNIHYEFTGGTEGPKDIYSKLSAAGIDTIVAMHLSEEHFKAAKEAYINVVMAGHIASDTLGINELLDRLQKKSKHRFKVVECSGFRRFSR